jgi:hypothetical protein
MRCASRLLSALALCAAAAVTGTPAHAGALVYSNQLAVRYNPLGLQDELRVGYRAKLGKAPSDDILFGKSYINVGAIGRGSPQFLQGGLYLKTLPIAVLELQASAVRVKGLSSLQDVQETSYFTGGTIDAATDAGDIITDGWQATIQPRLQYKTGNIAIRNTAMFRMFALDGLVEGGRFYDQTTDVVTDYDSWIWQNDVDAFYADDSKQWVLGARYSHVHPFTDAAEMIDRAGPVFAYKFKEKTEGGAFASPALIVLSQWHLRHAYRAGQSTSRAIPYFAVAYSFKGRLTK